MKKNPLEIQHITTFDYKASPFEKVILPLGSLESHGGHLPLGTDALTAHLIAQDIAAKSAPDGHTLFVHSVAYVVNSLLYKVP